VSTVRTAPTRRAAAASDWCCGCCGCCCLPTRTTSPSSTISTARHGGGLESGRLVAPRPGSPASSDEPVERWAAPEERLSHSDPHEGSGCHTLSSARAKSLRRRVHHSQARTSPHVEFCAVRPSDMIDSEEKSEVAP